MSTDSLEKGARLRHGDFIYRQTWLASSTDQKWRWALVAIWSLAKPLFSFLFWGFMMLVVLREVEIVSLGLFQVKLPLYDFWVFFFPLLILMWFYIQLTESSRFISMASTFYSIAADMVRMNSHKLIVRLVYVASGAIAVMCAILSWKMRSRRQTKLSITELDVLGSVLSKAKFWKVARQIYHEIGNCYLASSQDASEAKQIAVSFALASKWMLGDPNSSGTEPALRRAIIRNILEEYESVLEPEVLARLYEALDDIERVKAERKKIATKLA